MQSAPVNKPALNYAAAPKAEASKVTSKSYIAAYNFLTSRIKTRVTCYLFASSLILAVLFQVGLTLNLCTYFHVLISSKTLLFTTLLSVVSGLTFFLRELSYTVWEPTYPSYIAELLASWTSLDTLTLFSLHTISSYAIISTYLSWVMGENYTTEFLLKPPGHYLGARQINQNYIFICVYAVALAANHTYHYVVNRKYVLKINDVQQPLLSEIKTSLATVLCSSAMTAIHSFGAAYIIYVVCNGSIYYYAAHLLGIYSRVLDSPIIEFRWIDLHLFLRMIVSGILVSTVFSVSNRLYEITYSYTLPYTDLYANQFECLIEGLSEKKIDHIKVAAFAELSALSSKRPDKRVMLFNTVGRELQDSAWYRIMVQCFDVIQEFRSKIDVEYNGVQPATAPVPVSKPTEQRIVDRLEFSQGNIFTSAKKNQLYYDDRTSTVFSEAAELAENDLIATVPSAVNTFAARSRASFAQNEVVKMLKSLELKFGHSGAFESFYAETVTRRVQTLFKKYQLLIWAVRSLGSLTAGSLKEDAFGYVQNDFSQVLNQLLGCLVDVETYIKSPPAQYKKLLNQNEIVGETQAVIMALREAIYQITIAFKDYNEVFQIDGKYRKKWERFLTLQE